MRAFPPVFGYSELADEVKDSGDMQKWFTACLAMNAAAVEFDSHVQHRNQSAAQAVKRVDAARVTAGSAIQAADTAAGIAPCL